MTIPSYKNLVVYCCEIERTYNIHRWGLIGIDNYNTNLSINSEELSYFKKPLYLPFKYRNVPIKLK